MYTTQILLAVLAVFSLAALAQARPDGSDIPPLPGPGLSYGGIPYGSMSGNVAEFFRRQAAPSGRSAQFPRYSNAADVDFAPIEQWLR